MKKYSIGIDIGGTKCAVILGKAQISQIDTNNFILDRVVFDTEIERGPNQIVQYICSVIKKTLDKHQIETKDVVGIGISCGGPLDYKKGIIMNPPNLLGWDDIPIVEIIRNQFDIPTYLQNDANACALAEWQFGAAKGCENVIFLTFGTGMGAGIILNGRLYNGTNGMAGEIGHIRLAENGPVGYGKAGSLEGFCSGGGIAQVARIKVMEQLQMGIQPSICPSFELLSCLNAKDIATAAEKGDELALEIYRTSGHYLGKGLAIILDMLNPEIIVIGSIYERSKDLIWQSAYAAIRQEALERSLQCCQITPALLGNQIGDYASLAVALQGGEGSE